MDYVHTESVTEVALFIALKLGFGLPGGQSRQCGEWSSTENGLAQKTVPVKFS